jgi:hypothetical protein
MVLFPAMIFHFIVALHRSSNGSQYYWASHDLCPLTWSIALIGLQMFKDKLFHNGLLGVVLFWKILFP